MNKAISATSFGAFLLAGLFFQTRTAGTQHTGAKRPLRAVAAWASPTGDGPWIASCGYWSAARVVNPLDGGKSSEVTIAQTGGVKLQLKPSSDDITCGSTSPWGIDKLDTTAQLSAQAPEITAIVATVPDPIHSHLALDFDRAIDAILLAAADNHYLSSNYWLPWRSQVSTSSTGDSTSTATKPTEEDYARERQPGLIILRYAPEATEWQTNGFEQTYYRRVIYLFLVGETPALGVNGYQLQNAFSYEKLLKEQYKASFSILPWSPFQPEEVPNQKPNLGKNRALPIDSQASALRKNQPSSSTEKSTAVKMPVPNTYGLANPSSRPDNSCPKTADGLSVIGPFYSGSASSLHAGIVAALPTLKESHASITGITSTEIAVRELDPKNECVYRSFGENTAFEQRRFLDSLAVTGYDLSRVAVLSEAGTVFGSNTKGTTVISDTDPALGSSDHPILFLEFPRELSLLRNAEPNQSSKPDSSAPPTPYLNLSLKDNSADDTVPRFSTNQSPLSIESQLMAIAHQLQRARSQFIVISASNVLDDIFLAQFLHRACPDARLVILAGGDLLFERDVDNAPYIGSISISPYLLSSLDFGSRVQWLHADYQAEEIYNAASFTFWNSASAQPPTLAGYRNYPVSENDKAPLAVQFQQIPLWATVIGTDGYYPLAILNWCGSDLPAILPTISLQNGKPPALNLCEEARAAALDKDPPNQQNAWNNVPESIYENSGISPSLLWGVLTGFILVACILHCASLWAADLWSPLTRDLAIDQNDLPHRRAVYLNIGTSVLTTMAFVAAFPLILVANFYPVLAASHYLAWGTITVAGVTAALTFAKTCCYSFTRRSGQYTFFNLLAFVAFVGTILFWIRICNSGNGTCHGHPTYVGLYFSYRCLRPLSGVCPLIPILLLLTAWYLWAVYQTARLRFSEIHRPRLARLSNKRSSAASLEAYSPDNTAYPLFVPDEALEGCARFTDSCLYDNIMSLLITRQLLYRCCAKLENDPSKFVSRAAGIVRRHIDIFLLCVYLLLFGVCLHAVRIHSIERFLFTPVISAYLPTPYEFLIMTLFFPLIMVALSGWLRVILIWGALSRGLLEPLERLPIRFAFTRFKGGSWTSMLRQKGLHIRWRDMGRSTESIRQLVHHPALLQKNELHLQLLAQYNVVNARIHILMESIKAAGLPPPPHVPAPAESPSFTAAITRAEQDEESCPSEFLWDLPNNCADLCSIFRIEQGYAEFCRLLLDGLLVPDWDQKRIGHVEETNLPKEEKEDKSNAPKVSEPTFIQLAEELVVVRYVALIRAVLINIRYLMLFVTTAFVLAIVAWNSYPFQPHAFIDWCFTILLAVLTLGFVWVFAQMHRNAILSRITDTTVNELGWEFYLRIVTFGAVPVLTWLAYQFPAIGGSLYRIIQPGLQVVK